MKKIIFYTLLLFVFTTTAQTNHITISWFSPAKFQKITLPGLKHVFIQKCEPKTDSVVSNGQLQFLNASLGNISKCVVAFLTCDTILISSEIKTYNKKTGAELNDYLSGFISNYNEPFINYTIDKINHRTWFSVIDGRKFIIKYTGHINKKKASVVFMPDFRN